jgi:hypothetical protein
MRIIRQETAIPSFGLDSRFQGVRYIILIQTSGKRRIGKAKGVFVGIVIFVRQRIAIIEVRLIHIVKHHIHAADA